MDTDIMLGIGVLSIFAIAFLTWFFLVLCRCTQQTEYSTLSEG
jgi:hypothetical protein